MPLEAKIEHVGQLGTSPQKRKNIDLSRYLDAANLTERQYACCSLKLEYGYSVAEIARQLHIHRKTVDQHVTSEQQKMKSSRLGEELRRRLAKERPGY